jgi:pimeloyl-ACP methyl ester carboxylesterase
MKTWILAATAVLSLTTAQTAAALAIPLPPAPIYTDPPEDPAHPARSEVLHIPSGGVQINGLVYIAAGPGPHPTMVLCHGWPGNEKNLDLAQAVRRAGWNVVTFNYRGSWGSPGSFSFMGVLEDARAVLAYVRDPAVAARLQIDPHRLVLAGHSMGGWASAVVGAADPDLAGVVLISAADMSAMGAGMPLPQRIALAHENAETLAATPEALAEEAGRLGPETRFEAAAPGLARKPLLVLTADDGLAPMDDALVAAVGAHPGARVLKIHAATDHSWDSKRILLESQVIVWLQLLGR